MQLHIFMAVENILEHKYHRFTDNTLISNE